MKLVLLYTKQKLISKKRKYGIDPKKVLAFLGVKKYASGVCEGNVSCDVKKYSDHTII